MLGRFLASSVLSLVVLGAPECSAFQASSKPWARVGAVASPRRWAAHGAQRGRPLTPLIGDKESQSPTALDMVSPLFSTAVIRTTSASIVKKAVLALIAGLAVVFRNRILWPGSAIDKSTPLPLPPGKFGCPLAGINVFKSTASYGPGIVLAKLADKLNNPKLMKFFALGMPFVSVSGKDTIRNVVTANEFGGGVTTSVEGFPAAIDLFGDKSILYVNDKEKHSFLRKLVGVSMSPAALADAVPTIEKSAMKAIESVSSTGETANMWLICNDFTLDVAWRQILGLDLEGDEAVSEFYKQVQTWIGGLMSPIIYLPFKLPFLHRTKTFKAKQYLVDHVERKLAKLDRDGPDGSILSHMYFAKDDDGVTRLTRDEVIQNALILIVAGSETSSSTLTTAMLLLGLHKDILSKLRQEQHEFVAKHGAGSYTKDQLDADCPYLDAFIRETLRIRPIQTLEMRKVGKTIVTDGQQIPKGWNVWTNVRATHDMDPACRKDDTFDHMDLAKGFNPDRWLSPSTKPREFMPFGEGAHRCLGERLAIMEMKIFVATLVRQIEDFDLVGVESADDVEWKGFSAIPRPKDGVNVRPTALSNKEKTSSVA